MLHDHHCSVVPVSCSTCEREFIWDKFDDHLPGCAQFVLDEILTIRKDKDLNRLVLLQQKLRNKLEKLKKEDVKFNEWKFMEYVFEDRHAIELYDRAQGVYLNNLICPQDGMDNCAVFQ